MLLIKVSNNLEKILLQGDIERQKRKTATAIVTSGALTFMILAAALVTASFLMSPVIEDVFGKGSLQRKEMKVWLQRDFKPLTPCQNFEYGEKNSTAIWSMESNKETCLFEHAIGFKRIPWAIFEKMHFEKFKFLFQKYLDFKKYLEDLKDVKFNSGQLLFSAPN